MGRPRVLDLFCGAGGCSVGYARAGFDVTGVDIRPQPRYPFDFQLCDALEYVKELAGYANGLYDAIHASPPCQAYSPLGALSPGKEYPDLVAATREALRKTGLPWVMENVMAAPLRYGVVLCGGMFGLRTYRHRRFETSFVAFRPEHPRHVKPAPTKGRKAAWESGAFASVTGDVGVYVGTEAMGIDWMTGDELSQAIPPAYTEYIGKQLLNVLGV